MDIPQDPNIAQAPASPAGVPNAGTPPMSQDEMKANLQAMMEKIQGKYQGFTADKFSSDAKLKEAQSQMLRQFFDLLTSFGIDPSQPEEVKAFLDKIKQANPQLYQQIEQSLQVLLGNDQPVPTGEISQSANTTAPMGGDTPPAMPPPNMNTQNEPPQQTI